MTEREIEIITSGNILSSYGLRRISGAIADALKAAKKEITITTYGIFPDKYLLELLRDAAKRGIHVRIYVGKRPKERIITEILKTGCELLEIPPERGILHAKMIIVDSSLAIVGSFNLTTSGTTDNQELAVIIRNDDIASKLKQLTYRLDTAAVRIDRSR